MHSPKYNNFKSSLYIFFCKKNLGIMKRLFTLLYIHCHYQAINIVTQIKYSNLSTFSSEILWFLKVLIMYVDTKLLMNCRLYCYVYLKCIVKISLVWIKSIEVWVFFAFIANNFWNQKLRLLVLTNSSICM